MNREILLGDEAVALGAVRAGLTAGYSYPGTPASEIMEYLIRLAEKDDGFSAAWCINEKVAYEEALGVSYMGKRCLVSMKHVGLNVAADPFMNSALTAIQGGLLVVAADDPGMHSSQNEQDSRYYARFARIFCFEPADHQEAYDMTGAAFDLSEKYEIPVMLRMVTRLSHSRSGVVTGERRTPNEFRRGEGKDWTLLPANARRRFGRLLDIQADLTRESEKNPFNKLTINQGRKDVGIIASGIAVRYVFENLRDMKDAPSLLKVSSYPLPESQVRELVDHVETVIVVEEGYPFIEEQIRGVFGIAGKNIRGKQSGDLSLTGELSPDIVRTALGLKSHSHRTIEDFKPAGRPPQLCAGCPHIDTFSALTELLSDFPEASVFSDIGCYTLGALPPYNAIDTCVCMGASISMAKGASEAGLFPAVAVIGDSTFGHSGITSLLDAAFRGANMTVVIVDNATVAMTGGQPSFATGENLRRIVLGTGVEESHVRTITPLPRYKEDNKAVFREEIEHPGLSVILSVRACVQETKKLAKKRSA